MVPALLALFAITPVEATSYSAWLQCDGSYSGVTTGEAPLYTVMSNVDFGESFSVINSVTIYWFGEVTGGVWGYTGHQYIWPARFGAYLLDDAGTIKSSAYTDYFGYTDLRLPESFDTNSQFSLTIPQSDVPGSWDDLLDGKADFGIGLEMEPFDPMDTQRATGTLNGALLVIDAEPVPEPSSALPVLLGFAQLLVWRARSRNH
jgi:hypothetical protein